MWVADVKCYHYGAPAITKLELTARTFTGLHFNNVMLLNNARCSWLDTPPAMRNELVGIQSEVRSSHPASAGILALLAHLPVI